MDNTKCKCCGTTEFEIVYKQYCEACLDGMDAEQEQKGIDPDLYGGDCEYDEYTGPFGEY